MKKPKEFTHDGNTYQIVGRQVMEPEYGYVECNEVHYNVLQVKKRFLFWNYWEDVEVELIPGHAWISAMFLGFTAGGWYSELHEKCRQQMGME